MLYQLEQHTPDIHDGVFVADCAKVIGNVTLHENSSVWFGAIIRGDNEHITVGPDTNVQEAAVFHSDPGFPLTLGRGVTVGHKAMLHGCQIGDYSLIGINAVVLNGAKIGKHCLIGAGALVTEGMEIPDGSMVVGAPAKVKKTLNDQQRQMLELSAAHYVNNAHRFIKSLTPIKG